MWKRIPPGPSQSLQRRAWNWAPNWPSLCLRPRIWNTCSDNVLVPQQGRWPPARVGKPFSWDCRSPTEEKGYQRFCFSFGVCTRVGRCQRKDQEVSVCLSSFTSSATSIWANMTLTDVFFFPLKERSFGGMSEQLLVRLIEQISGNVLTIFCRKCFCTSVSLCFVALVNTSPSEAQLLVCLDEVKRTCSTLKVLWLNVPLIL